jgi:hypothetical protein
MLDGEDQETLRKAAGIVSRLADSAGLGPRPVAD